MPYSYTAITTCYKISPFTVPLTIQERAFISRPIRPTKHSISVLIVAKILAFVFPSICPFINALSMHHTVLPLPFVYPSIRPAESSLPRINILNPSALVIAAVIPLKLTVSMLFAIKEISFISTAVGLLINSFASWDTLKPSAFIPVAIGIDKATLSMRLIVQKASFVKVPIWVVEFALARGFPFLPKAFISRPIRPSLGPLTMLQFIFPLPLVDDIAVKLHLGNWSLLLYSQSYLIYFFGHLLLFRLIFYIALHCRQRLENFPSIRFSSPTWASLLALEIVPHYKTQYNLRQLTINNSRRALSSLGFCGFYFLKCLAFEKLLLKLHQVFYKSFVGLNYIAFLFYIIPGFFKHQVELLHEEGYDDGSTSGLAQVAVNKHIVVLKHGAEISMSLLEVGIYAFLFDILNLEPFVMLNAALCYLVRDLTGMVNLVVEHCQYAIDPKLFFEGWQGQNINPTEVEVSLLFWVVFFGKNVNDMGAVLANTSFHTYMNYIILRINLFALSSRINSFSML